MRYGFIIPGGDVRTIGELAYEAEAAGWDGVFIADAISIEAKGFPVFPWFDPWVALAVMAMRTERIRIGTMITAVPRRRPWKLAREAGTLDHLSNGRLILGVGVGAAEHDGGFYKVGEPMDLKARAERLDEGLEIMAGLWSGKPFSFSGLHYSVDNMTMLPATVQSPRIPLWVVGVWAKSKSMNRAIRWDGLIPQRYKAGAGDSAMSPEEIRAIKEYVSANRRATEPFDIIASGQTPGDDRSRAIEMAEPHREAGATWWLDSMWSDLACDTENDPVRKRIRQGPPCP